MTDEQTKAYEYLERYHQATIKASGLERQVEMIEDITSILEPEIKRKSNICRRCGGKLKNPKSILNWDLVILAIRNSWQNQTINHYSR